MKLATFSLGITFLMSFPHCVVAKDEKYRCPAIVRETKHFVALHKEMCYMFVDIEKYWDEARNFCWEKGGDMVSILDEGTMNFLKKTLNSNELGWRRNGVWIGAHDRSGTGWKWSTGERIRYSYWRSGKPSTILGFSFEDCAAMRRKADWRWDDHSCHRWPAHYNFICQFPFENSHIPKNVEETPENAEYRASIVHNEEKGSKNVIITAAVLSISVFLIAVIIVFFFIYRRRKEKANVYYEEPQVRFDNVSYSQVNQNRALPAPPGIVRTSCIEANEVNNLYEEVHKHFSYGVNQLEGGCACASAEGDAETLIKNNNAIAAKENDPTYENAKNEAKGDDHPYVDMGATGGAKAQNLYVEPTKPIKPTNLVLNTLYANQEPRLPKRENVEEESKPKI